MAPPVMQKSFNSGEWASQLYSRVDVEKYHSGAALLRNFFVDYRGGASTRSGTRYILQAYRSATAVRLIPFQASFQVSYILEFGDHYIRFYNNGAPVLEASLAITGATKANPAVISVINTYGIGDWVLITGVVGMTQLNGNYYSVLAATSGNITLGDLNGNPIDSTGFGTYVSGGSVARVYTITTPYAAADLALIKYAQNVDSMILCHPSYNAASLMIQTANSWVLQDISFGTSVLPPTSFSISTTLTSGSVNYGYIATSVAEDGEESGPTSPALLSGYQDLRTTVGSNDLSWTASAGSTSVNLYKTTLSYSGPIPAGTPYGFIGNSAGAHLIDTNIEPDFSLSPPSPQNPFVGGTVSSVHLSSHGVNTTVPNVTTSGGSPTVAASLAAVLEVTFAVLNNDGTGYVVGDQLTLGNGVVVVVATTFGIGRISSILPLSTPPSNSGAINPGGSVPSNPVSAGGGSGGGATFDLTWGVKVVNVLSGGNGYTSTPTVVFSSGSASAVAILTPTGNFPPAVPGFFQQRLVLAAANQGPSTFNMSQPGAPYNYDIHNPILDDDAIQGTLASGQLQTIRSMISTAAGLILFTDKASWLLNGGSPGSAIGPSSIVANQQATYGASDVPPILVNFDIIFVESKGSAVRDSTYNFYANVFTGSDISAIASHLFFGYKILEWCWAQEPFKLVWAIRNDGTMLCLTFAKEEDFIAWSHHDTQGLFKSVATVVEATSEGSVDVVYVVVQRTINGNTVQYIERMAERIFSNGAADAWCVDAGIQYNGAPATAFTGAQHLAGATVTGLADGVPIAPFVMPVSGSFTLPLAASKVTVGLAFTPQLQTLAIDTGEPTIQGKQKKINAVTLRVDQTLGLQIGSTFGTLVNMKDLVVGNVGSMTNQVVTDLVTGDARTYLDPMYTVPGQYCIQQSLPFPATITGVIPQLAVGDTR